jgi:hypothetical protein
MTPLQQLGPVTFQLASQLRGGHALGKATHDQDPLPCRTPGAVQDRRGEGVEDAHAVWTAIDQDRRAIVAMDLQALSAVTAGTGQSLRMQEFDQEIIASLFIHKVV